MDIRSEMDKDNFIRLVRDTAMRVVVRLKTPFDKEEFKDAFHVSFHDRLPALKYLGCKSIDQFILSMPNVFKSVVDGEFFYLPPGCQETPDRVRLNLLGERRERLLKLQSICLELARQIGQPFDINRFQQHFYARRLSPANFAIRKFGFKSLEELLQTIPQLARLGDGKYIIIEINVAGDAPGARDPLEDHRGIVATQNGAMRPFADSAIGHNDSNEEEEFERKVDVRSLMEQPPVPPVANGNGGGSSGALNEGEAGNEEEIERKVDLRVPVEQAVPPRMAEELPPPQVVEGAPRASRGVLDVRGFLERGGGGSPFRIHKRRPEWARMLDREATGGAAGGDSPSVENFNVKVEPPVPEPEQEIIYLDEVPAKRAHPENAESPLIAPAAESINNNAPSNVESAPDVSDDTLPDQMQMGNNNRGSVPVSPAGFFYSTNMLQQPASNGPSSKHEAFGCFIACCLDEAEKKGKDVGELTTKVLATLRDF